MNRIAGTARFCKQLPPSVNFHAAAQAQAAMGHEPDWLPYLGRVGCVGLVLKRV